MATSDDAAVYDDLLDLLADHADAERVLAFRLSPTKQARLDALLDKHRDRTLTVTETAELDAYERFEHVVRLLKARVLQKLERMFTSQSMTQMFVYLSVIGLCCCRYVVTNILAHLL
jgi:hypothetical protein